MKLRLGNRIILAGLLAAAPVLLPAATPEEDLQERVRHELVMLANYSVFDHLTFAVEDNVVTLAGQVSRPTLKSQAENVVKRIEGVGEVFSEIEVLPLSSFDNQIRIGVLRAIYNQPVLQKYAAGVVPSIHVIVKNGDVSLEGVVGNRMDSDIAFIKAKGVFGVFGVTNNLRINNG